MERMGCLGSARRESIISAACAPMASWRMLTAVSGGVA